MDGCRNAYGDDDAGGMGCVGDGRVMIATPNGGGGKTASSNGGGGVDGGMSA